MNIGLIKIIFITLWQVSQFIFFLPFKGKKLYFYQSQKWSRKLLKSAKITVKTSGNYDKVNWDKSYIFLSNHSSLIDIPVMLSVLKLNCRIVYKKELLKVPIFGFGLKLSPFIGVDRENAKKAMESLKQAVEAVKEGESVLIFPEGTRSQDGRLGEFKRGAMVLATKSGKPVIPVCINGAFDKLPLGRNKLKSGEVELIFGEEVVFEPGLTKKEELEKLDELKSWINSKLIV